MTTLNQLPVPPANKSGWPWAEETPRLPERMPDGRLWPRITIVTPSYNQGQFIEETIRSVLLQGYPNLEYIIIDGGSTDGSVAIIRKYEAWLADWVSEPDRGQSHAINKGFRRATGEIMAYLNSDDIYYPNTLAFVAEQLLRSNSDILIGAMEVVEICDKQITPVRRISPFASPPIHTFPIFANGRVEDFLFMQPSMFWRREVWRGTGSLEERYHYIMDREWCLRALALGARVEIADNELARFALHPGSKSQEFVPKFDLEKAHMYRHLGRKPGFRFGPCYLESLLFQLRYLQDKSYACSNELFNNHQRVRAFLARLGGMFLRRARLGVNLFGQATRMLSRKNLQSPAGK